MYDADVRVWYGPESYQNAIWRYPTAATLGSTAALPCIVYRPGGGWVGADIADLPSRTWWSFGLNDSTNATHAGTYVVFILQTASIGYNLSDRAAVAAWATATAYTLGTRVTHGGRRWVCYLAHTSGGTTEPGVGGSYLNNWRDVGSAGLLAWATATAYALGDYRGQSGRLWQCIDAHTSSAAGAGAGLNQPGIGNDWALFWREAGTNETGTRKVADLGELTPGGLDEMVTNTQQFIGWLRRNAATYGVNPDKICLAGASAGGQMAGCAAYAEDLPWSRDSQVYGASRMNRYHSTQPNAALLSWTPVDLTRHTEYSLLRGLYGEDSDNPTWVARAAAIKRAMSPLFVMKRTGLAIPTCLDYTGQGLHNAGAGFAGLTGSPYHHPDNGWLMLQALNAAAPTGLGQSGHLFVEGTSPTYYGHTVFTAGTATPTTYSTDQLAASAMLAWLNTAMS